VKVRAQVSTRPVSSVASELAGLKLPLQTPALIASPNVMHRMIRSTAMEPPRKGLDAERVSVLATQYNALKGDCGDWPFQIDWPATALTPSFV